MELAVNFCFNLNLQVTARNTNDLGCLCPQLDKVEQGLDLIQEAITATGLTPGDDFHIILNSAGHEMFDYVS